MKILGLFALCLGLAVQPAPSQGKPNDTDTGRKSATNKRNNSDESPKLHPGSSANNTTTAGGQIDEEGKRAGREDSVAISSIPTVAVKDVVGPGERFIKGASFVFSFILVIVGTAATIIGGLTLVAIRRQTDATEAQTAAVGNQTAAVRRQAAANEVSAEALIDSERAWVVVTDVGPANIMPTIAGTVVFNYFVFDLQNVGRTVARLTGPLIHRFEFLLDSEALPTSPTYGLQPPSGGNPIYGRVLSPEQKNGIIRFALYEAIDEERIEKLDNGKTFLCFYANLKYFDSFKRERELQFGYMYQPKQAPGAQPEWVPIRRGEYNSHT